MGKWIVQMSHVFCTLDDKSGLFLCFLSFLPRFFSRAAIVCVHGEEMTVGSVPFGELTEGIDELRARTTSF